MREEAIVVRDLSITAGARALVKGLNMRLGRGEVLLITGRSGSGKTSLLRAIAGIGQDLFGLRVEGTIRIMGEKPINPEATAKLLHYVPQEPWFTLTTPYVAYELLSYTRASFSEAEELLWKLDVAEKIMESSTNLSAGEAQRIALVEALLSSKSIVLVDEVTSYLDEDSRRMAVEAIRLLKERGAAVIIVDHDVCLWKGIADLTLYLGGEATRYYEDPCATPVYEEARSLYKNLRGVQKKVCSDHPIIEAKSIWYKYPDGMDYVIRGFSLEAYGCEIIWLRGKSGKGKTTLLKLLAGLYKPVKGLVKRPRRVQLVAENPILYLSSPTPREELRGNISLAELAGLSHALDTPILMLSSGERRRLAIVSAYSRQPSLLLVDEPTIGLDPWNAEKVLRLLANLAGKGSSIIVASHGSELGLISNRVLTVG